MATTGTIRLVQPNENEVLASLEKQLGPNHMLRTLAHRPEVLNLILPFYGSIVGPGSVDNRLKEFVYLTVSYTNQCVYCAAAHEVTARRAGIPADQMNALKNQDDGRFSEKERAVLRYARELTLTGDARTTREVLSEYFSDEQVVELTLVVSMANFTNRFNNALQVVPETNVAS